MQSMAKISLADALVKILEKEGVEYIFGHPGEQILPVYQSLSESSLKHVLMRHEQSAAHAADGYARTSLQPGVCISSGGPGALNMVMGVATAYKDSVPLLVITGDVPSHLKFENVFQEVDINAVFEPITIQSHMIDDPKQGIKIIKKAFLTLKTGPTGPIHLNIPRNILQEEIDLSILDESVEIKLETDLDDFNKIETILSKSERPLILAGAGVLWSHADSEVCSFAEKHQIPVASTYPARGVISEDHPLSLGLLGTRGTKRANYAGEKADIILAVGCRLSERTQKGIGKVPIIHVNLDKNVLKGTINIQADIKEFMEKISEIPIRSTGKWVKELQALSKTHDIRTDFNKTPLKPQRAIKEILNAMEDSILVNDAGSHTTWITLLMKVQEPSSLIFSGGFGPMGYGIPGSIGVSLARPLKKVVVVVGDGGFQMTSQELATIAELDLPITICVINNQSLGIIRQWQETYYDGAFQVKMENPDFVKLAHAYHIKAQMVDSPGNVEVAVEDGLKFNKPVLIEIRVDENENIPLPK